VPAQRGARVHALARPRWKDCGKASGAGALLV